MTTLKKAQIDQVNAILALPRKFSKRDCIRKNLESPLGSESCLDIGTGNGALIYDLSSSGSWNFADINSTHLYFAKQFLNGNFFYGDQVGNIFKETYNLVTCFDTLMYFTSLDAELSKFSNALKSEGRLYLVGTYSPRTFGYFIKKSFLPENLSGFLHEPAPSVVKNKLESAGLVVQKIEYFSGPFIQLFQGVLDTLVYLKQSRSKAETPHDLLTIDSSFEFSKKSLFVFKIVRWISFILNSIDRLVFSPRIFTRLYDGYLIIGKKAR